MKKYLLIAACAGALTIPSAASSFDWRSPNPDVEAREKSEQLHVSAGRAMARAARHDVHAGPIRHYRGPTATSRYPDMRERALNGHDY